MECFLFFYIIIIIWYFGMEDWIIVGYGVFDIVIIDSGYRLICRKFIEWKVLVFKVDRMWVSGLRVICCFMVWMVWILFIIKRMEELR